MMNLTRYRLLRPALGMAACMAALLGAACPARASYTLTDLGTLGGNGSSGLGINNAGEVSGFAYTADNSVRPFLYDGVKMINLGGLAASSPGVGYGIGDSGEVTGDSYTASSLDHAFLYDGVGMKDLGTLGGSTSRGAGVNSSGQVAGTSYLSDNATRHAFLYGSAVMKDLGTLGGSYSEGDAVNNAGQVTGYSGTTGDSADHAFLYGGGHMLDLGTLGGLGSYGHGINSLGQVAGESDIAILAENHAFLYDGARMIDLGTLGGGYSVGYGINKFGQVVGSSWIAGGRVLHAFLYSSNVMTDLNSQLDPAAAGWTLGIATGINDAGQITGTGTNPQGHPHAFLLTPDASVPLHTYSGVGWHLVSSPYTPSQTFVSLSITAFAYDPTAQNYVVTPMAPADTFHIGQGYWTYLRGSTLVIPGPGTLVDSTQPFPITLGQGWNLVGNPLTSLVPLASISVKDPLGATEPYTVAMANHTVSVLFVYNNASGGYHLLQSGSDIFNAWDGAWIYSKQAGTQLVFNPVSSR